MMPDIKKYKITEPYLDLHCGLGEAPFWEKSRNSLRFVDIVNKKLHTVNLQEGPSSHKQWDLDFSIGTTADIDANEKEFVFGGKYGYGVMNRDTGDSRWIKKMWTDAERMKGDGGKAGGSMIKEERMRSNDGAVDTMGRYWCGAMNDPAVVEQVTDEGMTWPLNRCLST